MIKIQKIQLFFYFLKIYHISKNNKNNNKKKYSKIISKQFQTNKSNLNLHNNKIKIKIDNNNNYNHISSNILSLSPSLRHFKNKLLYEKNIKKNRDIINIKNEYFNLNSNESPLTTRIYRKIKNSLNNNKTYYINKQNKNVKNANKSWNLKSIKNIKAQVNNLSNKKVYLTTYCGYFKAKK